MESLNNNNINIIMVNVNMNKPSKNKFNKFFIKYIEYNILVNNNKSVNKTQSKKLTNDLLFYLKNPNKIHTHFIPNVPNIIELKQS